MKSLRKSAELKCLKELCRFVRHEIDEKIFAPHEAMLVELVIAELCTNVIYYAYPEGGGSIEIAAYWEGDNKFVVEITDQGIPFNPKAHIEKLCACEIEEIKESTFGSLLGKENIDEVIYKRWEEKNQTTVIKYFSASP